MPVFISQAGFALETCPCNSVLRLKLRPDTPQQYENVSMSDIRLENGGVIFKVSPWTQYFDLKGQEPPKAVVHNIKLSHVQGTGNSLGEISGHDRTEIKGILLEDVDVQLKSPDFKLGKVQDLKFRNVKVNGKPMQAPAAS
ncbi:MAG: hypothetical protein INR73_14010 [Williamsia sp.]|nr:hypothetical protein [Williamsia sp.]